MKPLLTLLLLFPIICKAELFSIDPAGIVLEIPSGWVPLHKDTFPGAPDNMCFPRFDHKEKRGRIDAVIWKNEASLDDALDKYILRMAKQNSDSLTHEKISREPFNANSGVEGIKYIFKTTRTTACGPNSWKLVRYIFRNSQGEIVCLGGFGDVEEVDQIVISSLKIK